MNIHTLRIHNLRGLSHIDLTFDKRINVIVGPNAIGKTTILEAIRLAKALLFPRYFQEPQQVLVSLGAVSPHPQLSNYLDFTALSGDPAERTTVAMSVVLSADEWSYIRSVKQQLAIEQLKAQLARPDDNGQLLLTQYLSSPQGQGQLKNITNSIDKQLDEIEKSPVTLELVMDSRSNHMGGASAFNHSVMAVLERRYPPHQALITYFPADRAFPTGEAMVQVSSAEASNNMMAHIGQASTKYQRLKQTIVNNLLLAGVNEKEVEEDFRDVLDKLLPGKRLKGVSLTPVGTLRVAIEEVKTGKIFDIDSMSSGEKGLILTFMLLKRSVAPGGIALLDEPELHLNPAVCRKIISFLAESIASPGNTQIILCTHSGEIFGSAFDHSGCSIHHLRSGKDATRLYPGDNREAFEALRRLGSSAADSLFSRGNLFVEGDHDAAILEDGFYDELAGYKISSLGGRTEVEKDIKALQEVERTKELDRPSCFIFDFDRRPANLVSSPRVRVLQWDRYCLENYLINFRILFDELTELHVPDLESRGTFEQKIKDMAIVQMGELAVKETYEEYFKQIFSLRLSDVIGKAYPDATRAIDAKLLSIRDGLSRLEQSDWSQRFIADCERRAATLKELWQDDWVKLCSGKRLIDDLYKNYKIGINKLELKRRLIKRMKAAQSDEWRLVGSKINEAFS